MIVTMSDKNKIGVKSVSMLKTQSAKTYRQLEVSVKPFKQHTDFSIDSILSNNSKKERPTQETSILDLSLSARIQASQNSLQKFDGYFQRGTRVKNLDIQPLKRISQSLTISPSFVAPGANKVVAGGGILRPTVYKFCQSASTQCTEINCYECCFYYQNSSPFKDLNRNSLWNLTDLTRQANGIFAKTYIHEIDLRPKNQNRNVIANYSIKKDDELSYKCKTCGKVFGCANTLETHERTHKSPRYECLDCGKGFSQLRNYKYHLSVHRGTKEFAAECPECGKVFNDKGYLSSHMKIHRNKKEYQCPYCPKSFNQRVAFNMHVRIHTGVKPHKCAECGKRFSRKMLLKQHMRTHSGEKPYQCSVCGKSFADRSNMTLHHRLHSGIKPFSCILCPKAFTKKHHLKTHLNYHTGCKPYVCPHPNCNQAFTQSSNMRTHAKKCQFKPMEFGG